jgi:alkylation response protein AidB-like acyl-CoA dehydrogenase
VEFRRDPDDEAFREEVRSFLRESLPVEMARRTSRAFHPAKADMQAWTRILHHRGWSAPHWPVEHGGTGWSPLRRYIFDVECALAGAPPTCTSAFRLVAPVIYTFGDAALQQRYLPGILCGDEFWAQGFSEPNAGSDLASLRTSALRDGDAYIVNGQKTWTSEAHHADRLFCLVRTNASVKPQHGISFLLIDAHAPGVTIRPIISIDGAHSLNEVFFDNVHVPVADRVGEEGRGWAYAKFLLEHERAFSAEMPRNRRMFARLKEIARREMADGVPLLEDAIFARRIAEVEVDLMALEFLTLRALSEHGGAANARWPSGSVLHVLGSELQQAIAALQLDALGDRGTTFYPAIDGDDAPADYPPGPDHAPGVAADYLYRRAVTIYGGSNEIQRNLIAKSVLEL